MSRDDLVKAAEHLFASESIDQLRARLGRHAAHFGFWSVGGWSDRDQIERVDAQDRGSFAWDTFAQRLGAAQAAEFRTAIASSTLHGSVEEAADRLRWNANQRRPFLYVGHSPPRFAGFLRRFRSRNSDFRVRAPECLILPSLDDPSGRGRLFAGTEQQPSPGDTVAVSLLLMTYRTMNAALLAGDASLAPPPERGSDRPVELKPNEREVLRWAAAGKTLHDIAAITGLKYRTVRFLIECARKRYGYATTQQTIVRAAQDYGFDPLGPR